jgi:hypothetical protein
MPAQDRKQQQVDGSTCRGMGGLRAGTSTRQRTCGRRLDVLLRCVIVASSNSQQVSKDHTAQHEQAKGTALRSHAV